MQEKYLQRVDQRTRTRYLALDDPTREAVDERFKRHARASKSCGLGPDPAWLYEEMGELSCGRNSDVIE